MNKTITRDFAGEMRAAAKTSGLSNKATLVILKDATKTSVDETLVSTIRYNYLIGSLMGQCGIGDNAAIDYLPAMDAKPGVAGKWQPYPVKTPETFDAKVHRPLDVHNAYRAGLTAWSALRTAAGLPSLRPVTTRAARAANGGKSDLPITIESFVVPSNLDTAGAVKLAKHMADALAAALKTNAKHVIGDAGEVLRAMVKDMANYVASASNKLASDAVPAPRAVDETVATLNAVRAELEAAKAREAKMAAMMAAMGGLATPKGKKGKAA